MVTGYRTMPTAPNLPPSRRASSSGAAGHRRRAPWRRLAEPFPAWRPALLLAVLAAALPCPPGFAQPPASATAAPAAAEPIPVRPDAMIRDLYRARDGKGPEADPTQWTDPETAQRLFVPRLAALAVEDGQRPVPDRRVSFDPFTGATGAPTQRLRIAVVQQSESRAEVEVRFPTVPGSRNVTFRLVAEGGGWRIADIWWGGDRGRSLARLLR